MDHLVRPPRAQQGGKLPAQLRRRTHRQVGIQVQFEEPVHGAGDVARDAVDRLRLPAITLGRPRIGIGAKCVIKGAIVDKNARIGAGCVLIAEGKADGTYVNGAVVIRDGVLVVPKGATLPPGTVV